MIDSSKNSALDKISSNKFLKFFLSAFAIIGTIVTIYATFFQEKSVNLEYIILSNTNVLDINADISRLDILFDSTSLKSKKENIKILNLKILNSGNKDITIDFYDENDPVGFTLTNGYIVDNPELLSTSNDYLTKNLEKKIILTDSTKITFPKIIIESGEYFTLKLLIIHKLNAIPTINPIGKIASQKEIHIIQTIDKNEIPFLKKTFQGNIWVQLVRSLGYFILIVIIIIAIVFLSEKFEDYKTKKTRTSLIHEFKSIKTYEFSKMDTSIFDRYLIEGEGFLEPMLLLVADQEKLNKIYLKLNEKDKKKINEKSYGDEIYHHSFYSMTKNEEDLSRIHQMLDDGLVLKQEDSLIVNQAMRGTMEHFVDFLKEKDKYDEQSYKTRAYYAPK